MSRTRRNFSAKFKSELVIELLRGEKDLNTIAAENNIQPNLLRNWKKEFLDKASVVFDDTREENLKEKLASERREKAEYAKKVGGFHKERIRHRFYRRNCKERQDGGQASAGRRRRYNADNRRGRLQNKGQIQRAEQQRYHAGSFCNRKVKA